MRITNPTNAFVRIEAAEHVLLLDPWLTPGIYDGGWEPYPPVEQPEHHLARATDLYITHVHQDHLDPDTLKRLPSSISVLLPRVYGDRPMEAVVRRAGLDDVTFMEAGSPIERDGLSLELVPSMNARAQDVSRYRDDDPAAEAAIDTGIIVTSDDVRAVFLADNTPYWPEAAGETLERIVGCDLLAFTFNGAASDFPVCYQMPDDQVVALSAKREARLTAAMDAFIDRVRPKALLTYSADFAPCGPASATFDLLADEWWFGRQTAARRYSDVHGIPAFALAEDDHLVITSAGIDARVSGAPIPPPGIRPFTHDPHWLGGTTDLQLVTKAADHMFGAMDRFGLSSEWVLVLETGSKRFVVDLRSRHVEREVPQGRKTLRCTIDDAYLSSILSGTSHWNAAQLGFRLRWDRSPLEDYDHDLYVGLNFFHI